MVLESVYFLPHGGIVVPGVEENRNTDADKLHLAMERMAQEIRSEGIQLIFLTSPHGYAHPHDFLVYMHNVFEGWQYFMAEEEPRYQQYIWQGNAQVGGILMGLMHEMGLRASPLILANENYPLKLAWGETIPLSYIADRDGPNIVPFSLPMEIPPKPEGDRSDVTKLGEVLQLLSNSPLMREIKVSVIVSGDLSHVHDPNHEYGYHESSKVFDEMSMEWIAQPSAERLFPLYELHETAKSCGIYGMEIIQSILDSDPREWNNSYAEYALPSYFGMAVAAWKPK